jgi:hypothetical protein
VHGQAAQSGAKARRTLSVVDTGAEREFGAVWIVRAGTGVNRNTIVNAVTLAAEADILLRAIPIRRTTASTAEAFRLVLRAVVVVGTRTETANRTATSFGAIRSFFRTITSSVAARYARAPAINARFISVLDPV